MQREALMIIKSSEAANKVIKTEFIYQRKFETLMQLKLELEEYVYWYNNIRIHGSLDYLTPVEYRMKNSGNKVSKASYRIRETSQEQI